MIPTFPPDATIPSIHLACLRVGRLNSFKSSVREIYGINGSIHNSFGYKANSFIERALAGTMDPTELIGRHTMFPLVASALTPQAVQRWSHALATGDSRTHQRYISPRGQEVKIGDALRQCPSRATRK